MPLLTGTRVIGALSASSRVAGAYDDVHCHRLRGVGRLIGPFLVQEAAKEFDLARAGDRAILGAGLNACLWVPMHFGETIGGALFLGKHEAHWFDGEDAEIAAVVASRLTLSIQHQRLAEEQRRLASVTRRTQKLEHSLRSARGELHQRYGFEQIAGEGTLITAAHLGLRPGFEDPAPPAPAATPPTGASGSLQELERAAVLDALRRTHGRKSHAAALLGITRFQLYARLKRFGIDVPHD